MAGDTGQPGGGSIFNGLFGGSGFSGSPLANQAGGAPTDFRSTIQGGQPLLGTRTENPDWAPLNRQVNAQPRLLGDLPQEAFTAPQIENPAFTSYNDQTALWDERIAKGKRGEVGGYIPTNDLMDSDRPHTLLGEEVTPGLTIGSNELMEDGQATGFQRIRNDQLNRQYEKYFRRGAAPEEMIADPNFVRPDQTFSPNQQRAGLQQQLNQTPRFFGGIGNILASFFDNFQQPSLMDNAQQDIEKRFGEVDV